MNFEKLRKLAERNEVSLNDYAGRKRTPPYYYDSLRHALEFYFNTFNTHNESYDTYAMGLANRNVSILKSQLLDEDNTVLAIIAFERFFELFIKDILRRTNRNLIYANNRLNKNNKALDLVTKIRNKTFEPGKFDNKYLLAPFRETVDRFYSLIELSKTNNNDPVVKQFRKIFKPYSFLDSPAINSSMQLLNWYRDRILHNGNKLPTLWFLDYFITQRLIPIINEISIADNNVIGNSLFYFVTPTQINVLEKLASVKYEFKELKDKRKVSKIFTYLLYIGHLKELGRANLKMNLHMRKNIQATNEYNYKDPKGRALRFAKAEMRHPDYKTIKNCPCCTERTLVVYRITVDDIFNPGGKIDIDWVKCYMCDYHLRYNAGDPQLFNLNNVKIFD